MMSQTVEASTLQVELLAKAIMARMQHTEIGHCARVDYLGLPEAHAICQYILQQPIQGVVFHILTSDERQTKIDTLFITTDKVIEVRNRKQERLCLFVPSSLVDAAYSSISNSFALIDGRQLHTLLVKQVRDLLSPELASLVRAVFAHLRGLSGISEEQRLDFVLALLKNMQSGKMASPGVELWRVGLIADASDAFVSKLDSNRDCTLHLSRPQKLGATMRERIQSLKVDATTTILLHQFFQGRAMNEIRAWSRALEEHGLTFDTWIFPEIEQSDLRAISITPFVNARGVVERYCHLIQQDGIGGSLLARYGSKETLTMRWKTEPEHPNNLDRWRIGIVPSGSENGFEDSLDERSVTGTRRTITIKLDMDFEEPPNYAVCIRIAPLTLDGSEIVNGETQEPIFADSHDFFLVKDTIEVQVDPPRKSLRTVPTLAFGRLEVAVEMRENTLAETEPEWMSKDLEYFRLHINDRRVLNIGLNSSLLELERVVLAEPRQGGCFLLTVDEIRPVTSTQFTPYALSSGDSEAWAPFWKVREAFFKRLRLAENMRSLVEIANWTPELANSALRYAQAYRELIDDLVSRKVAVIEIREALSLDTLLIRNTGNGEQAEEAVVILPTHPLRAAWFASYTQLLQVWEKQLLEIPLPQRKKRIDLQALRLLVPTNVPAFAYHAASPTIFTFFQNLRFFHGVALPTGVPDPHRRYEDVTIILDSGIDQGGIGDIQPDQLAAHLAHFQELHNYAKTLIVTLVNPDRGDFLAEAIKKLPSFKNNAPEGEQRPQMPTFQIISYAEDGHKSTFRALEHVRQQQIDQQYGKSSDHLLPGLTTTARIMSQLETSDPPEAHIAVVTDFTRPTIVASLPTGDTTESDTSSFSLYGLINRFVSQFSAESQGLLWRHRIITEGIRKPEPHPAGPKYSETLIELQTTLLHAGGYLLGGSPGTRPVLEVLLEAKRRELLERLHTKTNWVITLDRFFTLDYYDSPNLPGLDEVSRKYVLDYSPEFTEGLGHRMMVTTAWHEEIGSLLSQAMDELGFSSVEESVSSLLHHLKTISGRLALDALESPTSAAAAVGLGVVTAWLQKKQMLRQAVLIPVDIYPRLFSQDGSGKPAQGERRCDLVLLSLKRNIVDATFIEVKWRRGNVPFQDLAEDMVLQMEGSAQAMKNRFFHEGRIDGALQRSYLANVLRFYFERSRRYRLFDTNAEASFLEHVTRLEKTGLAFRPHYEGYIVSLESDPRKPLVLDNATIVVLTAKDFESDTEQTFPLIQSTQWQNGSSRTMSDIPPMTSASPDTSLIDTEDTVITASFQSKKAPPLSTTQAAKEALLEQLPVDEVVIPLGESAGKQIDWTPGVKGSPHLFILGIPGQGKSWTITRLLSELGRQQVPALVLDFHGQFADTQGAFVKAMHPHVFDAAKGLPFSPFECTRENGQGGWMANALAVAEIFAYVAGLGEIQKDIVYTSVRDAYKAHGFADEHEEGTVLHYPTLKELLKRIEKNEQGRHTNNVAARCRPLLEMDLFRPPEENSTDFLSLIRRGAVIDLHDLFAESLQMATGAFVLRKLYKDMFRWGEAKHLRLAIVLDEAHRLAKDITLPKLMKEGRKFGISVIVASQGIGDFHQDVLSNAGTKILFRMNYPESRKVAGFIRGRQGQDISERIEQLSVGSAFVQTPEMPYGSVTEMYPLSE